MECDRAARRLDALADGALGVFARWRIGRHLAGCPHCAARLAAIQATRTALAALPRHRAPPALAARVGAAIAREAPPPAARGARRRFAFAAAFAGTGLSGALAGAAVAVLLTARTPGPAEDAARAVVDGHVRSLQPGHLIEVPSSDRHTVRPWLSARVPVSPPVPDLADEGFPLVGGRLDYIDGHEAAAAVYRHDRHIINLIAWASPDRPDSPPRTLARQGFNLITWRKDGATFWVVSDLELPTLRQFADRILG